MLYTVVFIFILLLALRYNNFEAEKVPKLFIVITFLILSIMSACRFQTGANSDMYRNYMHCLRARNLTWAQVFSFDEEILHQVLRKIVISIFNDPQAYFFVTAFFIVGVWFILLRKYSKSFFFSVFMFYGMGMYFGANNITRQYLAITIGLIGIKYIVEEKPIKYAICMAFAIGFHTSTVVLIPMYFLSKKKFNKTLLYIYTALGVLLVVFNGRVTNLLQSIMYEDYGSGYGAESSNALRLVWPLLMFVFLILINKYNYKCVPDGVQNKRFNSDIFNNLVQHGLILYIYFSLLSAVNMLMFSRVASYFSFYSIIILANGPYAMKKESNRKILSCILWMMIIVWFAYMNYTGKLIPTPYTPFWEYPWRAK